MTSEYPIESLNISSDFYSASQKISSAFRLFCLIEKKIGLLSVFSGYVLKIGTLLPSKNLMLSGLLPLTAKYIGPIPYVFTNCRLVRSANNSIIWILPLYAAIPIAVTPFFFIASTGKFFNLIISLTASKWPSLTAMCKAFDPFWFAASESTRMDRSLRIVSTRPYQAAIQNALTPFLSVLFTSIVEF